MKLPINKHRWAFLVLLLLSFTVNGQIYSGSGGSIPDDGTTNCFTINVPVLFETSIDTNYGLESVSIRIIHSFVSDLDIALMAPDSTFIELASGLGWDGDNYNNTYFNGNSYSPIIFAWAPFSGTFSPSGDMGIINNGQKGTGDWKLCIRDMRPWSNQGTLVEWSLLFGDEPSKPFHFESSNLPIVVINTHGQFIHDDPKIMAHMGIIDNGPGERNNITDPFNGYDGLIGIERRGSSSQDFPKKSWGFETWDTTGTGDRRRPDGHARGVGLDPECALYR